jgi:uncharacterized repeat protein (TIGR01451 family)
MGAHSLRYGQGGLPRHFARNLAFVLGVAALLWSGAVPAYAAISFDLSILKSHTGNFTAGETGTFTIALNNGGPSSTGVDILTVTDTLPAGLTYVSDTASAAGFGCVRNGQTFTCSGTPNGGTGIAKNATDTFTLTVAVAADAPATLWNTATVYDSFGADPNSANNSSTDVVTIVHDTTAPTVVDKAPLSNAAVDGSVTATFSEAVLGVDASSMQVQADGAAAPLSGTVSTTSTTGTFKPAAPLTPGTWYTVSLTSAIHDAASNALVPTSWRFRATTHVENTSPALVERWDRDSSSVASDGVYISSRTLGSAASLTFSATAGQLVSVHGIRAPNGGYADVYLDGVKQATVSFHAANTIAANVWTSAALTAGEHTVNVNPLGTKPAASTGSWVALDKITVGSTNYQESVLHQTFRRISVTGASEGSVDLATHTVDPSRRPRFVVTFFGASASVYATTSPDSGKAAIYIDNLLVKTVDLHAATITQQVQVFTKSLTAATHTIRIDCVGTSTGAKSAVRLDYFSTS